MYDNVSRLAIDTPSKIQAAEIQLKGDELENYGTGNTKSLILDSTCPLFPDEVKVMSDIPPSWFWAVIQKKAKIPIPLVDVNIWMKKGSKVFRQSVTYLTGLAIPKMM